MSVIFAVAFLSAFTYAFGKDPERVPPSSILGGFDYAFENKYHLSLNHKGMHVCSAALLKTEYDKLIAISAASCLSSKEAHEYTITFEKGRAGEDGDEYCILTKIRLYEDFDKLSLNNDIALLLSDDITKTGSCDIFMNRTLGVELANPNAPKEHVKVTGWDEKTETLKIIEDELCSSADVCNDQLFEEKNLTIGSTMLCYGVLTERNDLGKCRAEKGSPVVVLISEDTPVLVAVTSWTLASNFEDDSYYPCVATGVFDNVIKKWIESEVEEFASR